MYITRKALERVREEYLKLQARLLAQRAIVRQAIESGGGTHDNAMYEAALREQHQMAQREASLRSYLTGTLIEELGITGDSVRVGTEVRVRRKDNHESRSYKILGSADVEFSEDPDVISDSSPIARQLLGKSVEEEATIIVPAGAYVVEIVRIRVMFPPESA